MEDIIYNTDEVFVSNKRVTVGGVNYPINKIESVETTSTERAFLWITPLIAAAIAFVFRFWLMSAFFVILAVVLFMLFHKVYHVHLATPTGEQDVFSSRNEEYVATIVAQIKEALSLR